MPARRRQQIGVRVGLDAVRDLDPATSRGGADRARNVRPARRRVDTMHMRSARGAWQSAHGGLQRNPGSHGRLAPVRPCGHPAAVAQDRASPRGRRRHVPHGRRERRARRVGDAAAAGYRRRPGRTPSRVARAMTGTRPVAAPSSAPGRFTPVRVQPWIQPAKRGCHSISHSPSSTVRTRSMSAPPVHPAAANSVTMPFATSASTSMRSVTLPPQHVPSAVVIAVAIWLAPSVVPRYAATAIDSRAPSTCACRRSPASDQPSPR